MSDGDLVEQLSQPGTLLLSVVACICHEDISVANSTVSLLVRLGSSPVGLNMLYATPMLQALKGAMAQQDIIRFRVYEVMTHQALASFLVSVFLTKIFHSGRGLLGCDTT